MLNECNDSNQEEVEDNSSESDLSILNDADNGNYDSNTSSGSAIRKHFESHIQRNMQKLAIKNMKICKLDSISIPPSSSQNEGQHILNLKQEFTFPVYAKAQRDSSVQTSNLIAFRKKTPYPNAHLRQMHDDDEFSILDRPQSLPSEAMSNHKINRTQLINQQPIESIGDCVENNLKETKLMENDFIKAQDLELTGNFKNPVQCVLIKPR